MTGNMSREDILDTLAHDLGEMMLHLTTNYKGLEQEVAECLVRQLGAFIAIASKNPREVLDEAAGLLRKTPWGKIKAEHFGYQTLRMKQETLGPDGMTKPRLVYTGDFPAALKGPLDGD